MTIVLGLDVGSRTVDAVWLEDGVVMESLVVDSGYDAQEACTGLVARGDHHSVVATGYGRHAAAANFGGRAVSEISAYARGAAHLFPRARSVLDVGGQDTKAIVLGDNGRFGDFEMNDKCAAGTGRFLEVMAATLGYDLAEMGVAALGAGGSAKVSAMCTVFAESEVTTLLHRGEDRGRIALGVCESVAGRMLSMLKRIDAPEPLVFAGGVARNVAVLHLVSLGFKGAVLVPVEPQTVGALGAAFIGFDRIPRGDSGPGHPSFGSSPASFSSSRTTAE